MPRSLGMIQMWCWGTGDKQQETKQEGAAGQEGKSLNAVLETLGCILEAPVSHAGVLWNPAGRAYLGFSSRGQCEKQMYFLSLLDVVTFRPHYVAQGQGPSGLWSRARSAWMVSK